MTPTTNSVSGASPSASIQTQSPFVPGVLSLGSVTIARVLQLEQTTGLVQDVAATVASYAADAIPIFGAAEWKKYYGVDMGLDPGLPDEFYRWWLSPDALEPKKHNCGTHLPPVFRPRWVTETNVEGIKTLSCYSHGTLERLVQNPKKGPSSKYAYRPCDLQRYRNTKAGPACYLVMRKEVLSINKTPDQQRKDLNDNGADYEGLPSALDLATVLFATYLRTGGDRHLGNRENRQIYSRCEDRIQVGPDIYPLIVGGFTPESLKFTHTHSEARAGVGVAGLRKF